MAAHPAHPGLQRGLQLIALGLRSEGVREWNFSLRGLGDRELLAAAQLACAREVWDRCINASDRTRTEVDLAQRYPTPFREQVLARAREVGVEAAYVFGLIRQESRFILDARSSVGASGLMQLMPATARWTAQKLGLDWKPELITDRDLNLRLGMTYLRLLKDDFGGSNVMAAAAYNAGPGRPRRWREGGAVEAAAWVEGIPFNETRDYVKKVLANTVVYAALLGQQGVPVAGAPGAAAVALHEPGAQRTADEAGAAEHEKPLRVGSEGHRCVRVVHGAGCLAGSQGRSRSAGAAPGSRGPLGPPRRVVSANAPAGAPAAPAPGTPCG
ncbi:MAG: lytic transglycosylase domain-containing protein, partial [Pseudomonadota bacterium]